MKFCLHGENIWKEGILSIENNIISLEDNKSKKAFEINISNINDLEQSIQNKNQIMIIKSKEDKELLSTSIAMSYEALHSLERELILKFDSLKFDIYFTHAGSGGVLSLEDNINLKKGLLKITDTAMWIIGKENHTRIPWEDIVNAEIKKRSRFKGDEYGAVAIDYFKGGSIDSGVISTVVITKGDSITLLKRHIQELLSAHKVNEEINEIEKQMLTMMYSGAFELSINDIASSAKLFNISESEMKLHIDKLTEIGIISKDTNTKNLTKKGIKFVTELTKQGAF